VNQAAPPHGLTVRTGGPPRRRRDPATRVTAPPV
jgi:hypothetical protein